MKMEMVFKDYLPDLELLLVNFIFCFRSLHFYLETNTRKKLLNVTPRQTGNVENFLLVYLDSSAPDESILLKLRGLINCIKLFDDADDCIAFINTISNEKVILIVSDALGDPVVSRIQDLQQLFAVYVLCQTEEQADGWSTNQPKIRGINTDIDEILSQIKGDMENEEENMLTFTYSLPNANTKDEPSFVMNQIIKEILLDPDEMIEAKKELIDFCRNEYENNIEQLTYIQQFEDDYQKENILQFFQKQQRLLIRVCTNPIETLGLRYSLANIRSSIYQLKDY